MNTNKDHLLNIYRQVFDTWESYTHKVIDMMLLTPLPWEEAGRLLETISKLQSQRFERVFEDFTSFVVKNRSNGVLGKLKGKTKNLSEERVLDLESNEVEQLIEEVVEKTKTSKRRIRRKRGSVGRERI